jgi:hypothetical protein
VIAGALVDWASLAKALGAAFASAVVVAIAFGAIVRGSYRRSWPLVAVAGAACVAAAALGVVAMLHK